MRSSSILLNVSDLLKSVGLVSHNIQVSDSAQLATTWPEKDIVRGQPYGLVSNLCWALFSLSDICESRTEIERRGDPPEGC
jgi:hypothetical protein